MDFFVVEKCYPTELIQFSRQDASLIEALRFWVPIMSTFPDIKLPLASVAFCTCC